MVKTLERKLLPANLGSSILHFRAGGDDKKNFCEERNMSINNPTLNVLMKGYKRIMSLPFIKKEIKRPQKFEELSERDQEYFEVREYPLVKLYYEGELARIEALRKKRNEKLKQESEKLKQESEKFKQESEKKELLLSVVAMNFFDSGFPIDKIAENFDMHSDDICAMIDRARILATKSGA
jgi:hypothetical protein